ncbi:RPA-interacting protein isoform X2 [Ictalurus punctatus]|uniref:RPA-interacting protein isoform X2 n=1 Tax=Ictalurus punctatus TaxID=7998 RepID=A0A979E2I6_ICTPU|nr:RPA-interacting protein isoform X2 [Ictalurus punctatus]
MDALQRHRSLYKSTTPPWKETYRKRCVERLKNSRSRLLEKYRQMRDPTKSSLLVQEVMEVEWSALQSANQRLPSLWKKDGMYRDVQEHDELAVLEEIQQELISQELSIIEEYHKSQQYEELYLDSIVDGMEEDGKLICPVCHANNLTVNSHFTSCPCGLYINTVVLCGLCVLGNNRICSLVGMSEPISMFLQGRNITADVLQHLLELRVTEHLEYCLQNPIFSVASSVDGGPNLMMSCRVCDYLTIVL